MSSQALKFKDLPISERIQLVEDIWDSIADETPGLEPQLSAESRAELHRRLSEHRENPSSAVPWDQVRSELFKARGP